MICFVRLQTSENKKKREIANSTVREMSTFRTTIIKNGTEKKIENTNYRKDLHRKCVVRAFKTITDYGNT